MWQIAAWGSICLALACGRLRFDSDTPDAASPDADPTPDAQLVFHLDFEGSDPLSDKALSHTTGCPTNCPQTVAGAPRGSFAATFQAAPGCIHVADAPDLRSSTFTYAVWFRPLSTTNQTLLSLPYESETGSRNTFELVVDRDADLAKFAVRTYIYATPHMHSLALGEWHHAAGSYDGQAMRVYYDGVLVHYSVVAPLPLPLTANEPLIGCDRDSAVDYAFFRGDLDDVRIYSAALSDAEIAALAVP